MNNSSNATTGDVKFTDANSTVASLKQYLDSKGIAYSNTAKKSELLDLANKN